MPAVPDYFSSRRYFVVGGTCVPVSILLKRTGISRLRQEYETAYQAIDHAAQALEAISSNPDDYADGGDHSQAEVERQEALDKLCEARRYVAQVMTAFYDPYEDRAEQVRLDF
jgi:hypothetical protein